MERNKGRCKRRESEKKLLLISAEGEVPSPNAKQSLQCPKNGFSIHKVRSVVL
jgi:hypothetical protein